MVNPKQIAFPTLVCAAGPVDGDQLCALLEAIQAGSDSLPHHVGAVTMSDRRVDRALQWLRARGYIRFEKRRWVAVTAD